jgi:hypothetical protein
MYTILLILLFLLPGTAHADQFNDLYYIEPFAEPDLTEEGQQSESGGSSGGGDSSSQSSGGSDVGTDSGSGNGSSSGESSEDIPGADGDSATGSGAESEEDALEVLLEEGAVEGGGVGGSSAGGEEGGTSDPYAGSILFIDGNKVRAVARKDSDIQAVLKRWRTSTRREDLPNRRLTTGEYYALIASELAAEDGQLESASFAGGRFEITYRSQGELFWLIPMSFPVHLTVTAAQLEGKRVEVGLPWYHFFVREYFTRESLAVEVEEVISAKLVNIEVDGEVTQAFLFEAVARFLRQKVRTISDTVLLGQ